MISKIGYRDLKDATIHTNALISANVANSQSKLVEVIQSILSIQRQILFSQTAKIIISNSDDDKSTEVLFSSNLIPKVEDIREYINRAYLWSFEGKISHPDLGKLPISIST